MPGIGVDNGDEGRGPSEAFCGTVVSAGVHKKRRQKWLVGSELVYNLIYRNMKRDRASNTVVVKKCSYQEEALSSRADSNQRQYDGMTHVENGRIGIELHQKSWLRRIESLDLDLKFPYSDLCGAGCQ